LTLVFRPSIIAEPGNQTVLAGSSATFTVVAGGTPPLGYQWRKNGINLVNGGNVAGASSDLLTVSSVTINDASDYSVVVANAYGSVTSSIATLTLVFRPSIIAEPANQT